MYGLLWSALPGPVWVKALLCLLLFAVIVFVLMEWVFPAIAPMLPFNDNTVGNHGG